MKSSLLLAFCAATICIFSAGVMNDNGRAGTVGSPGETTCNTTNCHNSFALNSGGGSVTARSTMVNWTYDPLTTYSFTITVAKPGVTLFGFGAEILTSTNTNGGTIVVSDPAHTQIKARTVGGIVRRNIVHTLNGGSSIDSAQFTFSWTSPDTTAGILTLYFASNATNSNGSSTGDYIYTSSIVISPAAGDGISNIQSADPVSLCPNPAITSVTLHYFQPRTEEVFVKLYDLKGACRYVLSDKQEIQGEINAVLSLPHECLPGLYLLSIESASGRVAKKLMIN